MTTKYPIILVHGIAIKDVLFLKSFGKIDKKLKDSGYTVYKSKVDAFGKIEDNAATLKEEINKILEKENCEKVNIIAHSKGGLDAKYMIKHLGMEGKVASFTTLCTPHKGSPVAYRILMKPKWLLKIIAFWLDLAYRILGDKHPDSLAVCKQLAGSKYVEEETFDVGDKIYCQSYSTKMRRIKDDFLTSVPHVFFRFFKENENTDGLVTEDSAIFGEYKGNAFSESVFHSQVTDFMVGKEKEEKIFVFYGELCGDLAKRGF